MLEDLGRLRRALQFAEALPGLLAEGRYLGQSLAVLAAQVGQQTSPGLHLGQTRRVVLPGLDHDPELAGHVPQLGQSRSEADFPLGKGRTAAQGHRSPAEEIERRRVVPPVPQLGQGEGGRLAVGGQVGQAVLLSLQRLFLVGVI